MMAGLLFFSVDVCWSVDAPYLRVILIHYMKEHYAPSCKGGNSW